MWLKRHKTSSTVGVNKSKYYGIIKLKDDKKSKIETVRFTEKGFILMILD